MSDLDDFLAATLARQVEAEEAIHNGDSGPRLAMWSTQDPTWLLLSVLEPDPGDGGQPCLPVTGSGSGLQVLSPAIGSSLQMFIVAGQAATEITRSG